MKTFEFKPKLYTALKNYSKELFMADLMAGIIVGIVALPLAIAFIRRIARERYYHGNHRRFYHLPVRRK